MKHQPQRVGLTHELADEDIGECPFPFSPNLPFPLRDISILTVTSVYYQAVKDQHDIDVCRKPRRNTVRPIAYEERFSEARAGVC